MGKENKDVWNSRIRAFLSDLGGLSKYNERAREKGLYLTNMKKIKGLLGWHLLILLLVSTTIFAEGLPNGATVFLSNSVGTLYALVDDSLTGWSLLLPLGSKAERVYTAIEVGPDGQATHAMRAEERSSVSLTRAGMWRRSTIATLNPPRSAPWMSVIPTLDG